MNSNLKFALIGAIGAPIVMTGFDVIVYSVGLGAIVIGAIWVYGETHEEDAPKNITPEDDPDE